MSTQLTIDFNAVAYSQFYWKNQVGLARRCRPRKPTVNGSVVLDERALFSSKTMLEVAQERGLLDVWTPVLRLQFRSGQTLRFEGKKAIQMKKAYNEHIYKKG